MEWLNFIFIFAICILQPTVSQEIKEIKNQELKNDFTFRSLPRLNEMQLAQAIIDSMNSGDYENVDSFFRSNDGINGKSAFVKESILSLFKPFMKPALQDRKGDKEQISFPAATPPLTSYQLTTVNNGRPSADESQHSYSGNPPTPQLNHNAGYLPQPSQTNKIWQTILYGFNKVPNPSVSTYQVLSEIISSALISSLSQLALNTSSLAYNNNQNNPLQVLYNLAGNKLANALLNYFHFNSAVPHHVNNRNTEGTGLEVNQSEQSLNAPNLLQTIELIKYLAALQNGNKVVTEGNQINYQQPLPVSENLPVNPNLNVNNRVTLPPELIEYILAVQTKLPGTSGPLLTQGNGATNFQSSKPSTLPSPSIQAITTLVNGSALTNSLIKNRLELLSYLISLQSNEKNPPTLINTNFKNVKPSTVTDLKPDTEITKKE